MPKPIAFPIVFCLLSGLLFLPGCFTPIPQHAYYVSPLNGNNEGYHPLPLLKDTVHTAVYVSGSFFTGAANEGGTDYFNGGRLSLSVAHHYGMFQFCVTGILPFLFTIPTNGIPVLCCKTHRPRHPLSRLGSNTG